MEPTLILTEQFGNALRITLNRPDSLNALNRALARELISALKEADQNPEIGCIVLTGSKKTFAAGADIKEMQALSVAEMNALDWFGEWEAVAQIRKPIVAAVAGYALGGGCELALMCDFILAADNAKFGQPEIKLGVMPGMGGSQRLTHLVGQAKAMEMCLTGRMMDASEAEHAGLVSRVLPLDDLLDEAMDVAKTIAGMSLPAVMHIKEAVRAAISMPVADGVRYERRLIHALFASEDQKEGMAAFLEKRAPVFKNR